jgi:hypothetical protein
VNADELGELGLDLDDALTLDLDPAGAPTLDPDACLKTVIDAACGTDLEALELAAADLLAHLADGGHPPADPR